MQKALGQRFGVNAYPSFFVVHGSSVYIFEGARSKTNLIKFAIDEHKEQPVRFVHNNQYSLFGITFSLLCVNVLCCPLLE